MLDVVRLALLCWCFNGQELLHRMQAMQQWLNEELGLHAALLRVACTAFYCNFQHA
jgi:hypothetical protein